MKKRLISAVTLAIVMIGVASPALAVDTASSSVSVTPAPKVRPVQPVKNRIIKEKRQEAQERVSEARKKTVKRWWALASKRLERLIARETKSADRIQERLTRLSAAGKDVTKATADLVIARQAIVDAKTALANANAQIDALLTDNKPSEAFAKLRGLVKGVMEKIRIAHRALVVVLSDIKGMKPSASPTPTAIVSVSPTPTP